MMCDGRKFVGMPTEAARLAGIYKEWSQKRINAIDRVFAAKEGVWSRIFD